MKKGDGTVVAKGTARSLRIVKLNYRVQGGAIGSVFEIGTPEPNFIPAIMCSISQFGGSWESKTVLGEIPIYADGSAAFIVPARTPVYFQVLDSNGYCIATMRSWSTLMPGEQFICGGCHESKNEGYDPGLKTLAGEAKPLLKDLGIEDQYFDYPKFVQPIWDAHCISCHKANHESGFDLTGALTTQKGSKRWATSYNSLMKRICFATSNKALNICTIFSTPEQKLAYSFGSSQSPIMTNVINGTHHDVKLTEKEKRIVACWIDLCAPHAGYYTSYMSAADSTKYMKLVDKRLKWEAIEAENLVIHCACGPNGIAPYKGAQNASTYSAKQVVITYLTNQRNLVLDMPVNGDFLLLDIRGLIDLKGRVISNTKLVKSKGEKAQSIQLPATLSRGLYIAMFIGDNVMQQRLISITK